MAWPATLADQQLLANAGLTDRQDRVFRLKLAGVSTNEIARHLELDPSTVRHHYERARIKLARAKKGMITSRRSA